MIKEITKEQAEILKKYFIAENESFNFEGCWLRNQRPENANKSGYVDETTARRRYIHFYDSYVDEVINGKHHLALSKYYLYVTNTLPQEEIDAYYEKIDILGAGDSAGSDGIGPKLAGCPAVFKK